ncbi:MAG: leucine-rich repeat protein, partial [Clostridia bacterium]|nr:leucine-rich repeat protein [Clostridia bacterium]
TSIGDYAFSGCGSLTSINIPNDVTSISDYAFSWCIVLTSITIPDSVTSIGNYAFSGCFLMSITIPNSVTSIGTGAFMDCYPLECVILGSGITSIGDSAFSTCSYLHDVYYIGSESQKASISIGSNNNVLLNATWHYNCNPDNPMCLHPQAQVLNAVAATCTQAGYTGDTCCSTCDWTVIQGTVIPALGHNYLSVVTAPTCVEGGFTTYTCSRCGDSYISNYTQALNHPHTTVLNAAAATCTANGYTGDTYCYDCHTYILYGSVIPATGHNYAEVITAPTCTLGGYTTHTCLNCGDIYVNDYTAPTGHRCDDWTVTKNATCSVEGQRVGSCKFCGTDMTEAIPTIAHAYDAWRYETLPSCDSSGKIICTCLLCGDKKTITVDALGHEYSAAWTVDSEPACTSAGQKSHHCIRCDAVSELTEIPATGHDYTSVTVTPTCTKDGYTQHVCTVCGNSYKTDTVSATGHTFTHFAAQSPTCTEIGWNEYDTCDICGYTTYEEIDALGHDYQETAGGYECSRCGAVIVNSQAEHHFVKTIVKPTAEHDGYTQYTCTDCGYYYRTDETHFQTGAKLSVSSMVVGSGKKVILTVSISENPGIYSFTLGVNYDKDNMTLSDIVNLNRLGGSLSLGNDRVLWINNTGSNSTVNGDIFQLVFDVSAYAAAQDYLISLSYNAGNIANYQLENVNFALESGVISVEGFTAGDINGDGFCDNKDLIIVSEVFARNYTAYKKGKPHTEANRIKGFNLFGTAGINILRDVDIVVLGVSVERVALDINNDGTINNYDLLALMKYLRGEEIEIF